MKTLLFHSLLLLLLLTTLTFTVSAAPLLGSPSKGKEGDFIVVFNEDTSDDQVLRLSSQVPSEHLLQLYNISGFFRGFATKDLPGSLLKTFLAHESVAFVEYDQEMHAIEACLKQSKAEWGLDRINEHKLNLDGTYMYPDHAGSNVDAYIVDTGIYVENEDFQGRARWGADFTNDEEKNVDCNGHGTHVASTVGGTQYGVAKKTTLFAVKVLNCAGSGSNNGVIAGINWVADQSQSYRNFRRSVLNMSLGGGASSALDNALGAAVKAGVVAVVAAGNDNSDACYYSPARAASAITVGSTEVASEFGKQQDLRSYFSNWGTCVDILAPGSSITAAWIGSPSAIKTISGTSMASPHVAGAAVLHLDAHPTDSPTAVKAALTSAATTNVVDLDCTGLGSACGATPNALLYTHC